MGELTKPLALADFVAAARGAVPADLVLKNARVVNVLTGEIHDGTVGVKGDRILGFGDYRTERPEDTVDLGGGYVAPALWDAHLHIESTMTTPGTFARLAAAHGTAAAVTDPHEIANVRGVAGIRDFLAAAAPLPVDVFVMLPSCVPSTHLETAGATLSAEDLAPLYALPNVLGLAEMMNVPGFLFGDPGVVAKVEDARRRRVPMDGHSPLLSGLDLNAYVGAGIRSDHECLSRAEAHEKVRLGMDIWIREGTAAKNLDDLLPLVTAANSERFAFATDDRHPWDLLRHGHLDHHVRRAIALGLDPVLALRLASWSCARHYGFTDRGGAGPGLPSRPPHVRAARRLPTGSRGPRRPACRKGREAARRRPGCAHGGRSGVPGRRLRPHAARGSRPGRAPRCESSRSARARSPRAPRRSARPSRAAPPCRTFLATS